MMIDDEMPLQTGVSEREEDEAHVECDANRK